MIYAVLSDIHANATALRKVMEDAWAQGATQIVCLGDVVGYGPEPARSVAMLRIEKAMVIAGNHDDAVSGRLDPTEFTDFAADAVSRHREALRDDEKEWLGALPYLANIEGDAVCVHGDVTAPREFRYIDTTQDAAANFAVCANPIVFVGHTHTPCLFVTGKSGKTYKTAPQDFTMEPGKRYIVNVGTVGYPREENGTCLSSYVIYDSERREIRFRFLPFSVAGVMQRGKAPPRQNQATQQPASAAGAAASSVRDPAERRERRIVAAAIAAVAALSIATLAFVVATRQAAPPQSAPVPGAVKTVKRAGADVRKPPSDSVKRLLLSGRETHVRANVQLAKNSPPAILTINFLNQAGAVISVERDPFSQKRERKVQIPRNTHRVEFIVSPATAGKPPSILRFAPSAE